MQKERLGTDEYILEFMVELVNKNATNPAIMMHTKKSYKDQMTLLTQANVSYINSGGHIVN